MEINGSHRAILQTVSRPHICHPVFQETLQDLASEGSVPHATIVLPQVRLFVEREIDGILAAETIMGSEALKQFSSPITK